MLSKTLAVLVVTMYAGLGAAVAAGGEAGTNEKSVRDAILSIVPNAKIDQVSRSKLAGFHEAVVGGRLVYVSDDGRYVIAGSVWDTQEKRNITDTRYAEIRKTALARVPVDKRIVFPAKKEKHVVTVFTDIDCGYCRQLHQQIAEYNNRGITIQYLFFPRAGKGSEAWKKAEAVWCAADHRAALTKAKKGEELEMKQCSNPVESDYQLGMDIGVSGTPAIIAADGTQIGGYVPPDQMAVQLDQIAGAQK